MSRDDDWPEGSVGFPSVGPDPGPAAPLDTSGQRYVDAHRVGEGGMGRVDAVTDARLGRVVARKTAKTDVDAARLVAEARLTARLDHPGIVTVHDAGIEPDGTPWYTMRLVRGPTLADVLRDEAPDAAARQALIPRVLDAVHAVAHAHERGIVHRDLKPDNVVLGPHGETVVVDWGLAADVDAATARSTSPVGTPGWMAPEQAAGRPADRRTDVYALGRLLRAVLTGDPSASCGPEVPTDLAAIVDTATAPEPDARYADAGALADDLAAWLDGRLVSAHDYRPDEIVRRWLWTHRGTLGAVGLVLVVASAGVAQAWQTTRQERDRAVAAEAESQRLLAATRADLAERAFASGDTWQAAELAEASLAITPHPTAVGTMSAVLGGGPRPTPAVLADDLPLCRAASLAPDGRALLCATTTTLSRHALDGSITWTQPVEVQDVLWTDTGALVIEDARMRWLDAETGTLHGVSPNASPERGLSTPPDGWAALTLDHSRLGLWDPTTLDGIFVACPTTADVLAGTPRRRGGWTAACSDGTFLHGLDTTTTDDTTGSVPRVSALAELPDGRLVAGSLDGDVHLLEPDGRPRTQSPNAARRRVLDLWPDPTGQLVLVRHEGGPLELVDVATWSPVGTLPGDALDARWTPDGDDAVLLVLDADRITAWTMPARPRHHATHHGAGLAAIAASADGDDLLVARGDGVLHHVQLTTGRERHAWALSGGVVKDVDLHPRRPRIWTAASLPGVVAHIDLDGDATPIVHPDDLNHRVVFELEDGSAVVSGPGRGVGRFRIDGTVETSDTWRPRLGSRDHDARRALLVGDAPWLQTLDLATGELTELVAGPDRGRAVLDGTGRHVLAEDGGRLFAWPLETPMPTAPFDVVPGTITALALAEGVAFVALDTGRILGIEVATRRVVFDARQHEARIAELAVVPTHDLLLSASWDRTVRRWALEPVRQAVRSPAPPSAPAP